MERNGQRVIAKLRGTVDELRRGIRNVVDRVVGSVRVQFDFQHASDLLKILAAAGPELAEFRRCFAAVDGHKLSKSLKIVRPQPGPPSQLVAISS